MVKRRFFRLSVRHKREDIMAEKSSKFFEYKGYPLVRNKDTIYFGNMSDDYVCMLQIISKTKVGNIDIANRIRVSEMATADNLPPDKIIVKTSEKTSLYEALDIAYIWLTRKAS
jgi:hypothetical protein